MDFGVRIADWKRREQRAESIGQRAESMGRRAEGIGQRAKSLGQRAKLHETELITIT